MSDKAIEKQKRKIIFTCSPYGGKHGNLITAARICAEIVKLGYIPFAPHLLFPSFLDETKPEERKFGLEAGLRFMPLADECWVFIHDGKSAGMIIEEARARELGITIKFIPDKLGLK